MPIIKSAIKRVRQTSKRQARNVQTKRNLKVATKELQAAVIAKDAKKANELLVVVQSKIDIAVKKAVIHANKAGRLKSRYNAQVKALGGKLSSKPATKAHAASKTVAKKTVTKKPATKAPAKKPVTKAKTAKK